MHEVVWRIGDESTPRPPAPIDPDQARARLERGNTVFAGLTDPSGDRHPVQIAPAELGVGATGALAQEPWAVVLSCSDARVPVELVLNQRTNDLFVARVAGGVLSEATLGSIDFAVERLPTLRLVLALGHTGCGAVIAAVDTYLDPPSYLPLGDSRPLLAVVKNLLGPVRLAAHALHEVHGVDVALRPGYRAALIELSVVAATGTAASAIRSWVGRHGGRSALGVAYSVYDLASRRVGMPGTTSDWAPGLVEVPADHESFDHALREIAFGPRITALLEASHVSL